MPLNVKGSDSLYWKTGLDLKGLQSGVTGAKGILASFTKNISAMDVFAGLGISAGIVFTKISKQAYKFSKDFEHAMKEVQTISRAVQDDFDGVSQEVIELSKTVPDNATGLTKALYQIVSAGNDGAKAMDILRESAKLAVATVTETETAADAITSIMNAYGDAAGDAADISDKLASTIQNAKTTMEELGPEITTVTGLAAQAGLAFDDLMAIISTGAKTLKTPEMMTGIRGILTAIVKPSEEAKDLIQELGIGFDTATLKSKGFITFLNDLLEVTEGNVEMLARLFPNVRGLTGLLSVATDQGGEFARQLENITTSGGKTTRMFETMMEDTTSQIAILKNNVMAKLKPLGDSILEIVNEAATNINRSFRLTGDAMHDMTVAWSDSIETMRKRNQHIEDTIDTIERLRNQTELTEEQSSQLRVAEETLSMLLPEVGAAMREGADAAETLKLARQGLLDLNAQLIDSEIELADIELQLAKIRLQQYENEEDEQAQAEDKLKRRIERTKEYIKEGLSWVAYHPTGRGTGGRLYLSQQIIEGIGESYSQYRQLFLEIEKIEGAKKREYERQKLLNELTEMAFKKNRNLYDLQLQLQSKMLEGDRKQIEAKLEIEKIEQRILDLRKLQAGEKPTPPPKPVPTEPVMPQDQAAPGASIYGYGGALDVRKIGETYDKALELHRAYLQKVLSGMDKNHKMSVQITRELFNTEEQLRRNQIAKVPGELESINEIFKKSNSEILKTVSQGTQKMTDKELEAYRDHLKNMIKAAEGNNELQVALAEKLNRVQEEIWRREMQRITAAGQALRNLADFIGLFDSGLARAINLMGDLVSESRNLVEALSRGDIFSGLGAAFSMMSKIFGMADKETEDVKRLTDAVNDLLDKYNRAVAKTIGSERIEAIQNELEILRAAYNQMLAFKAIVELLAGAGFGEGLSDEAKRALQEMEDAIYDIEQELKRLLTGTIPQDLASGIVDGFRQGKTSMEDFAETFEDMMRNALIESFRAKIVSEYLTDFYDQFADMAKGGLTPEEIGSLERALLKVWEKSKSDWEDIKELAESVGIELEDRIVDEVEDVVEEVDRLFESIGDSLGDSIIRGFQEGKDQAEIFTETFREAMSDVLTEIFRKRLMYDYLEDWAGRIFNALMEGKEFEDIDKLVNRFYKFIEGAEDVWGDLQETLEKAGLDWLFEKKPEDTQSLRGAIRGITEETAGLLAGQFNAIRQHVAWMSEPVRSMNVNISAMTGYVESLVETNLLIAENTNFNRMLRPINDHLSSIDSKMSDNEFTYLRAH